MRTFAASYILIGGRTRLYMQAFLCLVAACNIRFRNPVWSVNAPTCR
jgi:hypothetical protein